MPALTSLQDGRAKETNLAALFAPTGWARRERARALARAVVLRSGLGWAAAACIVAVAVAFDPGTDAVFATPKYVVVGVTAVVLLALAAGVVAYSGVGVRWLWWFDGPIVLWVIANIFAYAASPVPYLSLHGEALQRQGLLATLAYVVVLYAIRLVGPTAPVPLAAALAGTFVAAYGAVQWLGLDPVWDELANGRLFSSIGQPNAFGAYMVMTVGFVAIGLRSSNVVLRLAATAGTVLVFGGIWLSFSRGAYMGALVGLLVTAAALWRRVPARSVVTSLLVVSALIGVLWVNPGTRSSTERVLDRGTTIVQPLDTSNSRRVDLWTVGLAMATDNPWTGVGQEMFPEAFPRYAASELSPDSRAALAPFRPESPHNVYVAAAAGVGIPGGLAYLTIVGAALVMAWRLARHRGDAISAAVLFAVVAHAVTDVFITAELAGSVLFWALLGWLAVQQNSISMSQESTA